MATKILSFATKALRRREALAIRLASHSAAVLSRPAQLTELANGIRVATEDMGGATAAIDVCIESGSRYETESVSGLSSLVVHSLLNQIDEKAIQSFGGDLRAQVSRDSIHLTLRCLATDLTKGIEIMGRLVSVPDFSNIETARNRVFREMAATDADNEAVVMNGLHAMAFQNTSLALPVIGRSESLSQLTREDCQNYVNTHFKGPRIVVAVAGDVHHDDAVKSVDKSFSKITSLYDKSEIPILPRTRYTGSDIRIRDDAMPLAHIVLAVEGAARDSNDAIALNLASELFGSWDRSHGGGGDTSSYLGICSAVDNITHGFRSFNISYADTGLFGAYFVVERMKQEDLLWHTTYEWKRYCMEITDNELNRGKNLLVTKMMRNNETPTAVANNTSAEVLTFGRRVPLGEWRDRVLSLKAARMRDICTEHIWDRCPVVSCIGPIEQFEDYEVVRGKFSWVRY